MPEVKGSRPIRVLKRDRSVEQFDLQKLAASLWRCMQHTTGSYYDACQLSAAVEIYLTRSDQRCVSTQVIFEMNVKVLYCVGFASAGEAMSRHCRQRKSLRQKLRIRDETGRLRQWSKGQLVNLARNEWHLSSVTARIIAGQIESDVLGKTSPIVTRAMLVEMLNRRIAEYGLADAVSVPP